jgi:predicted RNA-binding protein with PUA-like domain
MKYWLMKSEPTTYSIDDFARDKKTLWECIRNYQARNFMTKEMSLGDQFLFYHSSCEVPGAMGIGKVSGKAVPDPTAFDKKSEYFEPKATKENPIWECVEVQFVKKFGKEVALSTIRDEPKLKKMMLLKRGVRLSIQPVTKYEFELIFKLGDKRKFI